MTREVEFLSVIVSKKGLRVNPGKTEVIRTWPKPTSIWDVLGFLGLASFFRRFIRNLCDIAFPLAHSTRKGKSIHGWDDSCTKAMKGMKKLLVESPILFHLDFKQPYGCHVETSL